MFDYTKAAGMGKETIDPGVLGLPFLNIIQKGSPEFDETHPKFTEKKIEGCRPGNILFEPERAILPQPLLVVPLAQIPLYTEWKPNKGGFVGNRSLDITQDRNYRKGTPGTPTEFREYLGQNELVYTITFLLLFKQKDVWKKGMIAFTSTQLKAARLWSKTILGIKFPDQPNLEPPMFAAKYEVTTFADSNAKGGFFSWRITNAGLLSPEADQALLEQAFDAAKNAQLLLPRPQSAQAALAAPTIAEVVSVENPY